MMYCFELSVKTFKGQTAYIYFIYIHIYITKISETLSIILLRQRKKHGGCKHWSEFTKNNNGGGCVIIQAATSRESLCVLLSVVK